MTEQFLNERYNSQQATAMGYALYTVSTGKPFDNLYQLDFAPLSG